MKILYINTCFIDIHIKLFNKNKIIAQETVLGQKNNSQFIMPTIKKVLGDIVPEGIVVVNGPGSFTGVRLGVTVAKTFAYLLKIPIWTVTSLEEMAYSKNEDKEIFALKENNGYFIGIFDKNDNIVGEYKYLKNSEYEEFFKKYDVMENVAINYSNVINKVTKKNPEDAHKVKAVYVKKIEAELDKRS